MAVDPKLFKEGETEFGVFYPKGYVLAAFPDAATAEAASDALRGSGFADADVRVMPGADAVARNQDVQDHRTVGDRVRQFFAGRYGDGARPARAGGDGQLRRPGRDRPAALTGG